ncbi:MAG: class I SAM-dependent methyltransferase [Myxococcota bacterium]|jgi:ubiquinone/menaquinone biosynthesis C-methylase UbiE|nr:class I SAM-dependent methyltransferase [Myxococcota bacterium]
MNDAHARRYYDDFSSWYEKQRHHGYHAMLDDLETSLIAPHCEGRQVLEVGCGTGLIMERLAGAKASPSRLLGVDLSMGMVRKARERGHGVVQGSATALPFGDERFDVAYSVKVLAHVPDIRAALSEMARVLRPGGLLIAELYNRHSVRYLAKRLTRPGRISESRDESEVFTRWDSPSEAASYLPADVALEAFYGVRVLTPSAALLRLPVVREVMPKVERLASRSRLGRFGGFLVMVARKRGA